MKITKMYLSGGESSAFVEIGDGLELELPLAEARNCRIGDEVEVVLKAKGPAIAKKRRAKETG